jgi:hypothetical protein
VIIANLVALMRETRGADHERETLEEMLTLMCAMKKGRAEAQSGAHDDLVMALCHRISQSATSRIRRCRNCR